MLQCVVHHPPPPVVAATVKRTGIGKRKGEKKSKRVNRGEKGKHSFFERSSQVLPRAAARITLTWPFPLQH